MDREWRRTPWPERRALVQRGSEHRDLITPGGFLSNNAGGILGGISSGQTLVAHIAIKPTSSILKGGKTLVITTEQIRQLLDSIDLSSILGVRDRAIISRMGAQ